MLDVRLSDELALPVEEQPSRGMINLQGARSDSELVARIERVLPAPLAAPNRFVESDGVQCIWQGPNEWLITVAMGDETAIIEKLEEVLADRHHAVTDVTGNRMVLRLGGRNADMLLSMACSLDFDQAIFPRGAAAQTLFARTPVTILRVGEEAIFDIHIRRSYARYLRSWFEQAVWCLDGR